MHYSDLLLRTCFKFANTNFSIIQRGPLREFARARKVIRNCTECCINILTIMGCLLAGRYTCPSAGAARVWRYARSRNRLHSFLSLEQVWKDMFYILTPICTLMRHPFDLESVEGGARNRLEESPKDQHILARRSFTRNYEAVRSKRRTFLIR